MKPIAVITGTTHGIGLVTTRELAKAGFAVVMLCRDLEAAARVRQSILDVVPQAEVRNVRCDLANLASVRESAAAVRRDFGRIALLINNAGMVSTWRRQSAQGLELTFATNHLGPFLLTQLLLDRMTDDGRIVNLASRAHYKSRQFDLSRVDAPRAGYSGTAAYAQSKLANVMYTFALARRLAGVSRVTVNCVHPGVVASNLLPPWLRLIKPLLSPNIIDVERGARTTLYLALSNEVAGVSGRYYDEHQKEQQASAIARDERLQETLWEASERWVKRGLADQ
jgi:retinol dehydrogenase 12